MHKDIIIILRESVNFDAGETAGCVIVAGVHTIFHGKMNMKCELYHQG